MLLDIVNKAWKTPNGVNTNQSSILLHDHDSLVQST